MDFLSKLPKTLPWNKGVTKSEYYFGLNIEADKVTGCVWGIEGKRLEIVNSAITNYSTPEELALAANLSLDEALADFSPEPSKVLFGVPDNWLQDDNLKPEHLSTLKKVVKELDVTPMAYVSTTHAMAHALQKQQGIPVTAVLVKISDPIEVTVIKAGKILGTKFQKRSANLPQDIERALLSFTDIEVLPSKILVYGSDEVEKFKDELTSFSWMAQLPFLHLPKIEELESDIILKAVCFAGASELSPDVSYPNYPIQIIKTGPVGSFRPRIVVPTPVGISNEYDGPEDEVDLEDTREAQEEQGAFGARNYPQQSASRGLVLPQVLVPILAPISHFLSKIPLPKNIPGVATASGSSLLWRKSFWVPIVVVVLFLLGYIFLPHAKVTVFLDLRVLEKDSQVTANPDITAVDEANKEIPGKIIETQVTGSGKGSASGSKEVGDAAKGTVIVYNKTAAPKTFAQGTVLTSGSLQFKIDSGVSIASQSAVEGGISYGKATVNATAMAIGPDSNIPAGKDLTVGNESSSSYSAKVDQAFSGGVSKKVTVVTADDQKKLLAQVLSDLRKKAKDQLQGKLEGDYKILEEALSETVSRQSYSKNVNDQAQEFNLDLNVRFKGTAYRDSDLKSIVSKLVETNIPDGYALDLSQTETQAEVSKLEKDGKLVFLAKFKAKLMPKLDQEKIRRDLVAKTPEQTKDYLKSLPNVIGSDIALSPSLPGPLQRLPVLSKNITLEVTAK